MRISTRSLAIVATVLALSGAMVAFVAGQRPEPPPLRLAIGPWIGYEPFALADENGGLRPRVRLIETASNTQSLRALADGRVDLAGLTLDEVLRARAGGVPLRIVALLSDSAGADGVVVRPDLPGLGALRGQTVLVEDDTVGRVVLEAALAEAGLAPTEVRLEAVQAIHMPARWREGTAAAAVSYEPMLGTMVRDGGVLRFSTRDHPGLVYDVLAVREDVLATRAEDVAAALAAWEADVDAFLSDGGPPTARLAPGLGLGEAEYRQALSGVRLMRLADTLDALAAQPSPLAARIESGQRAMGRGNDDLRPSALVDLGPLKRARRMAHAATAKAAPP